MNIVQKVFAEQGLEQFAATVGKALQNYQAPPVGLEPSRISLGKRSASSQGVAKWLAVEMVAGDCQELPDAAKVFLAALLQAMV